MWLCVPKYCPQTSSSASVQQQCWDYEFLVDYSLLQLYQPKQREQFPSKIAGVQPSTSREPFIKAYDSYVQWKMINKMEKGKRNTLKQLVGETSSGLVVCGVVLRLQISTHRFEPLHLQRSDLNFRSFLYSHFLRLDLVLRGKFSRDPGFPLMQNVNHMENVPELCGSSSFMLRQDAEIQPLPLGADARSVF